MGRSNDELAQFASVASHDLRSPLNTIGSFAQLLSLRYTGKLDTDAQDYLVKGKVDGDGLMRALRYAIARYRDEEALRQSEARFRAIAEQAHDLICILDEAGRVKYESPAYARLLGRPLA